MKKRTVNLLFIIVAIFSMIGGMYFLFSHKNISTNDVNASGNDWLTLNITYNFLNLNSSALSPSKITSGGATVNFAAWNDDWGNGQWGNVLISGSSTSLKGITGSTTIKSTYNCADSNDVYIAMKAPSGYKFTMIEIKSNNTKVNGWQIPEVSSGTLRNPINEAGTNRVKSEYVTNGVSCAQGKTTYYNLYQRIKDKGGSNKSVLDITFNLEPNCARKSVSFNSMGGSSVSSITTFSERSYKYYTITPPTKEGYAFEGFYSEQSNGKMVFDKNGKGQDSTYSSIGKSTLYAHWKEKEYTVTFDKQGGSGGDSSATATYTKAMPKINPPTRTGYTFQGYFTGTNGSGTKYYDNNGNSVRNWDKTSNTTLYAYWSENEYELTMNANGGNISANSNWTGSGTSVTKKVKYTKEYGTLPTSSQITRTGYTFAGWWTADTGGTQVSSSTKMDNVNGKTIFAHWTANSYTLTANANGGTIPSTSGWSGTGSTATKSVTYDSTYGTLPTPTRTGYTFNGWKYDLLPYDGTFESYNIDEGLDFTMQDSTGKVSEEKALAGKKSYKVEGTRRVYKTITGKKGKSYTFSAWIYTESETCSTTPIKFEFFGGDYSWNGKSPNFKYKNNKQWQYVEVSTSPLTSDTTIYLFLYVDNTNKPVYFDNIFFFEDGSDSSVESSTKVTTAKSHRISAYWTTNTYSIKFDANGGSGEMDDLSMIYDTPKTLTPNTFTRQGYYFTGWKIDYASSSTFKEARAIIISNGIVVNHADYIATEELIPFKNNTGKDVVLTSNYIVCGIYAYDANGGFIKRCSSYAKTHNIPTGTGFIRIELNKKDVPFSQVGSLRVFTDKQYDYIDNAQIENISTEQNKEVTLYAVWQDTWANHVTQPTGSGMSDNPYIIDSAEDLAWMINNHGGELKYYKQTKAINLNGRPWFGIGTSASQFKGVYNGQGYEITNLQIPEITNANGQNIQSNVGLFGYCDGAEITGVYLKNAIVSGKENVGLIAGYSSSTKIHSNIIENGRIKAVGKYGAIAGNVTGGEIKFNLAYITTSGGTSINGLYNGSATLSTNLIEKDGTRVEVGTREKVEGNENVIAGWGKVSNRLLPKEISWGAQVLSATSADFTNWINKTLY